MSTKNGHNQISNRSNVSKPSSNHPESASTTPGDPEKMMSDECIEDLQLFRKNFNEEYGIFFDRNSGKFYYTKNSTHESTWIRPDGISKTDERLAFIRDYMQYLMIAATDNKTVFRCLDYLQKLNPYTYLGEYFASVNDDDKKTLISKCCVEYYINLLDERMLEKDEYQRLRPEMSWEAVTRVLKSDKRFYLIPRPSQKKAIFHTWKETAYERKQRTKEKNYEQYCKIFMENMPAHISFNSKLDYTTASEIFSTEPFWNSIPEIYDKRYIFEEVMIRIQKKIYEEQEKDRAENNQLFAKILKETPAITYETTWHQAKRILADNPKFCGPLSLFITMDKEDALCIFVDHMEVLMEEYEKSKVQNEAKQFRKERKMREKFQELLDALRQRNIITLKTKWKDISSIICKEDCFDDLLELSGPTPIDFFKFFMIDWNEEYQKNLDDVLELVEKECFDFKLSTTFEAFIAFIGSNSKSSQINKINYQYIYDSLLQDLIERTCRKGNAVEKLRQTFSAELKKLESNHGVNVRDDIEAVIRYFKAKWNVSEKVESIILQIREEYLGREEGEILPTVAETRQRLLADSNRSSSLSRRKDKYEMEYQKHHNSSSHRDYQRRHYHRRRSSSIENDRHHHENSSNYYHHHRNYRSSRRYY